MKIVQVTYISKPEYAVKNAANIIIVMSDLKALNHPGIFYTACLGADAKSFTHTAYFNSEADQHLLNELPSFRSFQEQLKAAGFESPPKQELLSLVGSSKTLFNL